MQCSIEDVFPVLSRLDLDGGGKQPGTRQEVV
jgi:hypothetical protein